MLTADAMLEHFEVEALGSGTQTQERLGQKKAYMNRSTLKVFFPSIKTVCYWDAGTLILWIH